MTVDLKNLPWQLARDIIQYCWENQIEMEKCFRFIHLVDDSGPDSDSILDIPEQHITWFLLKHVYHTN